MTIFRWSMLSENLQYRFFQEREEMEMRIGELKRGDKFTAAGIEWMVLGHQNNIGGKPAATHVISSEIVECRAFDEGNCNNFAKSSLLAYLNGEFLERLEKDIDNRYIGCQRINLTSDDGLDDYGCVETKIGLLTADQYREHRDILQSVGDGGWWWLATPYSTERAGYPSLVRSVYSGGTLGNSYAHVGDYGVRPALYLKSDMEVKPDNKHSEKNDIDRAIEALEMAMEILRGYKQSKQ